MKTIKLIIIILVVLIIASCGDQNWYSSSYKSRVICDTTLPEGVFIKSYTTDIYSGDCVIYINSYGKVTKWVRDRDMVVNWNYGDTIRHCTK